MCQPCRNIFISEYKLESEAHRSITWLHKIFKLNSFVLFGLTPCHYLSVLYRVQVIQIICSSWGLELVLDCKDIVMVEAA